jgi:hypothetical protein
MYLRLEVIKKNFPLKLISIMELKIKIFQIINDDKYLILFHD